MDANLRWRKKPIFNKSLKYFSCLIFSSKRFNKSEKLSLKLACFNAANKFGTADDKYILINELSYFSPLYFEFLQVFNEPKELGLSQLQASLLSIVKIMLQNPHIEYR